MHPGTLSPCAAILEPRHGEFLIKLSLSKYSPANAAPRPCHRPTWSSRPNLHACSRAGVGLAPTHAHAPSRRSPLSTPPPASCRALQLADARRKRTGVASAVGALMSSMSPSMPPPAPMEPKSKSSSAPPTDVFEYFSVSAVTDKRSARGASHLRGRCRGGGR